MKKFGKYKNKTEGKGKFLIKFFAKNPYNSQGYSYSTYHDIKHIHTRCIEYNTHKEMFLYLHLFADKRIHLIL